MEPEAFRRWSIEDMVEFLESSATVAQKAAVLSSAWQQNGPPLVHYPRADWVKAFRSLGFINGFSISPDARPIAPLMMWRAATPEYARGLSWTTSRAVAEWYLKEHTVGPGEVYECVVRPDWVLARLPQGPAQEHIVEIPEGEPMCVTRAVDVLRRPQAQP